MCTGAMTINEPHTNYNVIHPEEIMRVHRTLDSLGGGYLLKRNSNLDTLGGGYLLKRSQNSFGPLDTLGGGYLL